MSDAVAALAEDIIGRAAGRVRYLFAIAGPPGAGKSSLAETLLAAIEASAPGRATLVPMDGYHLDNAILSSRSLLSRKGAPETFDVAGLLRDLERIRAGDGPVAIPVFDRRLDLARAAARIVGAEQPIVLIEGNYLLMDDAPWNKLCPFFDRTLMIAVSPDDLRRRLIDRWLEHGLDRSAAEARAEGNDMLNTSLILARSRQPDINWNGASVR